MINLIKMALCPKIYLWIDVLLLRETKKAILIEFDGSKTWFPKTWVIRIKRNKSNKTIKIKISEYYWTRKLS